MKSLNWKLYSLALIAGMFLITSCSDTNHGDGGDNDNGVEEGTTLKGILTSNMILKAGNSYKLSGEFIVENGATLQIEEGVTIAASSEDDIVDYILVKQGGKINAVGTAIKPIVMTSDLKEPGAWGGIHICGKAQTNVGLGVSEIGDAAYGGNDDTDNSGILRYVRVE